MKICVICDKRRLLEAFEKIVRDKAKNHCFEYYCTPNNDEMKNLDVEVKALHIKECTELFINKYELIISLHCKQIIPKWITEKKRCINIHPGYNPYNRGWHPHVFSIMNGYPTGVTIHEIDEKIDHGPIIYREMINTNAWESSKDVYEKIIETEISLLEQHINDIIDNDYDTFCSEEGNINSKQDLDRICQLDLDEKVTVREFINVLRALSFDGYKNLWFKDDEGNKVYLSAHFEKEEQY